MVTIIRSDGNSQKLILSGSHWALEWGEQTMYFRLPTDVAASGYRYGCIGLQIWLRWVKDSTASGYRYGWTGLHRRLDSLIEPLE